MEGNSNFAKLLIWNHFSTGISSTKSDNNCNFSYSGQHHHHQQQQQQSHHGGFQSRQQQLYQQFHQQHPRRDYDDYNKGSVNNFKS